MVPSMKNKHDVKQKAPGGEGLTDETGLNGTMMISLV